MNTIEFGTGLRARLGTERAIAPVDQRPIYELLRSVDLPAVQARPSGTSPSAASSIPYLETSRQPAA